MSIGTASNALGGKGRVSATTRARVAKVAAELEFVPHRGARGLPTGRMMTIGVRFGHDAAIPGGDFFVEMLGAAVDAADKSGYSLLICRSEQSGNEFVDAQIVVDPTEADNLEVAGGVPVVTVGRNRTTSVPWVDVDHERAMKTLLSHLAERADDGPVWFVTLAGQLPFADSLEVAVRDWARDARREYVVLRSGGASREVSDLVEGRLAGSTSPPPALVVTALDRQAVGAQHALAAAGLAIPLGSASDGEALSLITPAVSAMALDGAAHGRAAVAMLLDWLRTGEVPLSKVLPAQLRAR